MKVIGPRVIENYLFLKKIAKSRSDKRRLGLLKNASSDQLLTLVEVASNLLTSNYPLTKCQREKIKPYLACVRKLAHSRSEQGARRIVQIGNGAFIPSLLIPIITEAARYIIDKL